MTRSPADIPALPAGLREIADHAGREAALAVAATYGGRDWRVPARQDSPAARALAEAVGPSAAAALVTALGGHVLDIPLARRAVTRWLAGQGLGSRQIAARLRISERTARRYIKGRRDGDG